MRYYVISDLKALNTNEKIPGFYYKKDALAYYIAQAKAEPGYAKTYALYHVDISHKKGVYFNEKLSINGEIIKNSLHINLSETMAKEVSSYEDFEDSSEETESISEVQTEELKTKSLEEFAELQKAMKKGLDKAALQSIYDRKKEKARRKLEAENREEEVKQKVEEAKRLLAENDELEKGLKPEIPVPPAPAEIPKQAAPEIPEQAPEIPKPIPDGKKPSFIRKFSKYILASIIFSSISLAVAFGGGFAAISALFLKAGLIIPATKIAIFAVSVSMALLATGLIVGLYAGLRALKASYDYFKLTPEGRYNKRKSDLKAVMKPLKEELRKTGIGMVFVNDLKAYGKKIPHAKFDQHQQQVIDNNNPHTRLEFNKYKVNYLKIASKLKGRSLLDAAGKAKVEIQRKFNLN